MLILGQSPGLFPKNHVAESILGPLSGNWKDLWSMGEAQPVDTHRLRLEHAAWPLACLVLEYQVCSHCYIELSIDQRHPVMGHNPGQTDFHYSGV